MSSHCVVDFDQHAPEFVANRDQLMRDLRTKSPIAWNGAYGGYWVVTSHELICSIARDDVNFSVERFPDGSGGITIPEHPHRAPLLPGEVEGDQHEHYRAALNPYFSKARVETLRPFVEEVVDRLLDKVIEMGRFDFVVDFAQEIPHVSVYTYTGIGIEDEDPWDLYYAVEACRRDPSSDEVGVTVERLKAMIRNKRANPADDVLGHLTQDPQFSDDDLVGLCVGLILGGVRNTADMIGQLGVYLDRDRPLRERLISDPTLIPAAIEEILRDVAPTFGLARTAMNDVEVGGVQIRRGDRVLMVFHSANHDEEKFPEADNVDVDRKATAHLSFGRGVHFCLGAWLARLEMRVTIERLLDRMPNYSIDHDQGVFIDTVGLRNAWLSLPAATNL